MIRPRLREVADLASVSEPTVSRVLNGRAGVAPHTRQRVLDALESLGFTELPAPPPTDRGVVGVICGDLLNPVFPTLLHHVASELGRSGRLTSVAITDRLNTEARCIDELLHASVDGVVFVGGAHAEIDGPRDLYHKLADGGVPMVFVNGTATDLQVPHIRCDERAGAQKAVSHLVQLGHRRIGCLLGASRFVPTQRFTAGYRQSLARLAVDEPADAIVHTAFTLEGGRAGAGRLLDNGITAVIAGNDLMALGAIQAAAARGLDVPREFSVVGYDGTEFTALSDPPLTTLRQPFEDMARLIAEAALAEIGGSTNYRDHYVFEPELLSRRSSGPLLAD